MEPAAVIASLEPELIRTERTDLGRVLELLIGFPGAANPDEEAGKLLMDLALGDQPANLVIDRLPLRLNARNLLPVGDGNLVDKGGNHPDLAILSGYCF